MSRFQETARTIPPATLGAIGINASLYIFQTVSNLNLSNVTLSPRLVLYQFQVYRIVTSALFHGSLIHIGMNMMSLSAVGSLLERKLGTMRMILTMLWSILVTALLHIFSAWFLYAVFGIMGPFIGQSVGYSGVIFHLSVLECNLESQSRNVFGLFQVPSYLYPWVLLVVLQFVMPNLSFAGHLSGIVAGTLQLYGMLNWLLPKESALRELDGKSWLRWLSSWPSFVSTTSDDSVVVGNGGSLRQGVGRGLWSVAAFMLNIAETIKVAVFGRGSRSNANIQLGLWDPDDDDDNNEDSWSGLPTHTTTSEIV